MSRIGKSFFAMALAYLTVAATSFLASPTWVGGPLWVLNGWAAPFALVAWGAVFVPLVRAVPQRSRLWTWYGLLPTGVLAGAVFTCAVVRFLFGPLPDAGMLVLGGFGAAHGFFAAFYFLILTQREQEASSGRRESSGLLLVLAATTLTGCAAPEASTPTLRPPNIVLFFADDAGYVDFGFQGNESYHTPRLDRLAAEGVRFAQAYVSASVCSPSRAGLLTGRYQQRFGHEYNLPGMADDAVPDALRGLPTSERTMAELLREAGYATGLVGKWHLGLEPHFHPQQRGFDEFFGLLNGSGGYHAGKATRIERNGVPVAAEELPYLTDAFGAEAADFVERHADEPFFLLVSFTAPHTPMQAREDLLAEARDDFRTAARAKNAAMTHSLDDAVGEVLAALDAHGLTDDTLVVFTNDNGGAMPYNASDNGILRGTKGTVLEGGVRVPMLMRWPVGLDGGRKFPHPVSTLDLLPTFLAAAGAKTPPGLALDGVDLLPTLRAPTPKPPHEMLYWKLNWGAAIREGDWKLVRTPDDEEWLFFLPADPSETVDLAAVDVERAATMSARLRAWEAELPPPIWVSAPRWREHSLERYAPGFVEGARKR